MVFVPTPRRRILACLAALLARIHPVSYGAFTAQPLLPSALFHQHHATEESGGVVASSNLILCNQVVAIANTVFIMLFDFEEGGSSS